MQQFQKTSVNNLLPISVIFCILKTWLQRTPVSKNQMYTWKKKKFATVEGLQNKMQKKKKQKKKPKTWILA